MKYKFYGILIVVFGLGAFAIYDQYNKAVNFEQTLARVTNVEEICYLTKTKRGIATKTRYTSKEGPCDLVKMIQENHPEYQDYRLVKNTYVAYEYKSPADGRWRAGKHKQELHDGGAPIKYGDNLVVLAHKEMVEKTRSF